MALREHIFSWYLCFGFVLVSSYSVRDTLKQGYQLNDSEYLISAGRVFTLGFFVPKQQKTVGYFTPESAQNCYIGIWYTYDEDKKPVWVANRNKPISKGSGALVIDKNGDLKILHKGLASIVLTSNQGATKTVAVLTDDGNFVLRELNSDGSAGEKVLWQSFDYPTDTLLPGMRLGFNTNTGQNWSIISWVNDQVPALGPFTLGIDPNGTNQLIMWRRGKIHWSSGIWNESKFENLKDDLYSFDYVSNKEERYFTLSLVNNWHIRFPMYQINGEGVISKLDFSRWGTVGLFLFSLVNCKNISHQLALGCVEQKLPECRSKHRFDKSKGYVVSEGLKYEEQNYILGVADCEAKCLANCSCVAYASIYRNGTGCQFWSDIAHLVVDEDEFVVSYYRELYIEREYRLRVQLRQRFWWIWLLVGTAGLLLLLPFAWLGYRVKRSLLKITHCFVQCFCVLGFIVRQILKKYILGLYYHVQRSLEEETRQMEEEMLPSELGSSVDHSSGLRRKRKLRIGKKKHGMQLFSFKGMVRATDNFLSSNKLGQGGYGIVYKGMLEDGQEVAIKRLSRTSRQGTLEFMNEIKLVAKLQHTNLVKLIGCCIEQGEKMVVYEFMQNKSLDCFLFDSGRKSLLDWKTRFNIIEGVAQGLLYLHKYSRLKIIHRDLKAGNILLDRDLSPKISDFGMAKIFELNESGANTERVVGTFGYMPPEYAQDGYFSVKSDVFSFGVLMLEIISGKKNNESYCLDRLLNLVGYAWELSTENRGSELIDQTLILGAHDHAEAMKCINVGLLCVQEHPEDRPTMSTVVAMISNEANELPEPKKPGFFIGQDLTREEHREHDLEQGSLDDASITQMKGR